MAEHLQNSPLLEVLNLKVSYGNVPVLHGVSLKMNPEEMVSIVGANGAGKTTLLNTISGTVSAKSGAVRFHGQEITGLPAHRITELGMIQVPEGRHLFPYMTVLENLELGAFTRRARSRQKENLEKILDLLPLLKKFLNRLAGTLSGGEQQMLAIGRGLMAVPEVFILDEPSFGLAPALVDTLFDFLKDLNKRGTPILLVEQNVSASLSISQRGYVLENGAIVLEGLSQDLLSNEGVKKAYLGM